MRSRRQELHTDANPPCAAVSRKDDPAFLLFLRFRVHQHKYLVVDNLVPQHQQAAMRIHHQRLADLAEPLPRVATAERLQFHAVEDPLAAPVSSIGSFLHTLPIMSLAPKPVNCPFVQVFPWHTVFGVPKTCKLQAAGFRITSAATGLSGRLFIDRRRDFLHPSRQFYK